VSGSLGATLVFRGELKVVGLIVDWDFCTILLYGVYVDASQLPTLDILIVKGTWIVKI
jgi:hypothetical protein